MNRTFSLTCLLGLLLAWACSSQTVHAAYKVTSLEDVVFSGDDVFLLLHAEEGKNHRFNEGFDAVATKDAFGVVRVRKTGEHSLSCELMGVRDLGERIASSFDRTRGFLSTNACLITTRLETLTRVSIYGEPPNQLEFALLHLNRFCLTPNRMTLLGCGDNTGAWDANLRRIQKSTSADKCAQTLCDNWLHHTMLLQAAVTDDLMGVAIFKGEKMDTISVHNLRSEESRTNSIPTSTLTTLIGAQSTGKGMRVLFSREQLRAVKTEATLAAEDGTIIGRTDFLLGSKVAINAEADRIAFVVRKPDSDSDDVKLIRFWYPAKNVDENFEVDLNKIYQQIHSIWKGRGAADVSPP